MTTSWFTLSSFECHTKLFFVVKSDKSKKIEKDKKRLSKPDQWGKVKEMELFNLERT